MQQNHFPIYSLFMCACYFDFVSIPIWKKTPFFSTKQKKKISTKCMKQNGAIKISMTRLLLSSEIDSNDKDIKKFSNYLVPWWMCHNSWYVVLNVFKNSFKDSILWFFHRKLCLCTNFHPFFWHEAHGKLFSISHVSITHRIIS